MIKRSILLFLILIFSLYSNTSADIDCNTFKGKNSFGFFERRATSDFFQNIQSKESKTVHLVYNQELFEEKEVNSEYDPKKKSLTLAIIFGLIPINGLGHFYAEEYFTGAVLFLIQIGTALYIYPKVYIDSSSGLEIDGMASESEDRTIKISGEAVSNMFIIFFGQTVTYLYDAIGAPLAVQRYNHELEKKRKANIAPYLDFTEENSYVGISINF